jgi:phasin family protein
LSSLVRRRDATQDGGRSTADTDHGMDALNHDQDPTMAAQTSKAGSSNPFTQTMGQARSVAEDFTRMFSDMKLPGVPDMDILLSVLKRNMETLSAVNRIALEGAQAVATRHMEITQQTISELSESMLSLATLTDAPEKTARQTELLKKAYERGLLNTRELGDVIQRSGTEAMEVLSHRFTEMLDEVKSLTAKSGHRLT